MILKKLFCVCWIVKQKKCLNYHNSKSALKQLFRPPNKTKGNCLEYKKRVVKNTQPVEK